MKVVFHDSFRSSYGRDPAAVEGRIDAVLDVITDYVEFIEAKPAEHDDIAACHTVDHINYVAKLGLYNIAALAAGASVQAATIGLKEPSFALIRPPGHHASSDFSWGYCFFNNIAIAISKLKREEKIRRAFVLDIDHHCGDGTINILGVKGYTTVCNPEERDPDSYLRKIEEVLSDDFDVIGVSAGFDSHQRDWGGLLCTEHYREIGELVKKASLKNKAGCFAVMEGGYNHDVLGRNVMELMNGMKGE
jgi:acetoin utilization deacetylase AcuC-like enzyme